MAYIESDIVINSASPEVKHLQIFKNDPTPWSHRVRDLAMIGSCDRKTYDNLVNELYELSNKENFVFEIHNGWNQLEEAG